VLRHAARHRERQDYNLQRRPELSTSFRTDSQSLGTYRPDLPIGCLEGLEQYSHVWILFVFHRNTDLQRLWSRSHAADGLKAKVRVPRLNGSRMGCLATRSPHRPVPIGDMPAFVLSDNPPLTFAGLCSSACHSDCPARPRHHIAELLGGRGLGSRETSHVNCRAERGRDHKRGGADTHCWRSGHR
jgi:tRNA (Thr-GGU) A37 N-methylase